MLTTVRRIFGRVMHSQTALHSQLDKGWKNNLLFTSPSIRRPTAQLICEQYGIKLIDNFAKVPVYQQLTLVDCK